MSRRATPSSCRRKGCWDRAIVGTGESRRRVPPAYTLDGEGKRLVAFAGPKAVGGSGRGAATRVPYARGTKLVMMVASPEKTSSPAP